MMNKIWLIEIDLLVHEHCLLPSNLHFQDQVNHNDDDDNVDDNEEILPECDHEALVDVWIAVQFIWSLKFI